MSPPIFWDIFGQNWATLEPVFLKHYANRPFSNDVVTVQGVLNIKMSRLARLLGPVLKLTKTLVSKEGENISITVRFRSEPDTNQYCFDRVFTFADGSIERFYSRMEPVGGNEVIEWTACGIGWHAAYTYQNRCVILTHKGYCIRFFGKRLRVPLTLILGRGGAKEQAISATHFDMHMQLFHPLLGEMYSYGGTFKIIQVALDA